MTGADIGYLDPRTIVCEIAFPCWLDGHREIKSQAKFVYGVLLFQFAAARRRPDLDEVAGLLGSSKRSVQRSIKELCELGLIGIVEFDTANKRRKLTYYTFPRHRWMDEAAQSGGLV